MKINLRMLSAAIAVFFLMTGCKKDSDSNVPDYIKATVNGNAWLTNDVTVQTVTVGSEIVPQRIIGISGSEGIFLQPLNPDPGIYPFKVNQPNPVSLLSFTVEYFESTHLLKWSTATETNLAGFTAERSSDGGAWSTIGTVTATGSNSSYQFIAPTNNTFPGIPYYFRLKINNTDGSSSYSSVVYSSNTFYATFQPAGSFHKRGYDGVLEITSHDRANKVIKGRFNFKVKTNNGTLYTLTNGEFKASY